MLSVERLNQFKRDYKKQQKRHKKMDKLHTVIKLLVQEKTLPSKYHDHTLTGNWAHHRQRHVLPLSDFLYDLLARRKVIAINDYVFPANSKTGYINDPRKAMRKVIETSGIEFTLHDLRRTLYHSSNKRERK